MLKINRKLEYALMALKHLYNKRDVKLITTKELTEHYSLPYNLIAKVLQMMAGSGILQSEKGAHGGYRLIRPLDQISIRELSAVTKDQDTSVACHTLESENMCEFACQCNIISPITELAERINHLLEEINVLDLILTKEKDLEYKVKTLVSNR